MWLQILIRWLHICASLPGLMTVPFFGLTGLTPGKNAINVERKPSAPRDLQLASALAADTSSLLDQNLQ